ncbi:putative plastid-lipid-associated protein 4 [Morus notabilis]|uniref:Putative plastid-lipid-associated protein 4 n=1 Tax=Morus notabilis TaxID=981085 RepID=W9SBH2_9ROSA|nr:putative plastid-lipid-associated protein 4 [Morus notabilis]
MALSSSSPLAFTTVHSSSFSSPKSHPHPVIPFHFPTKPTTPLILQTSITTRTTEKQWRLCVSFFSSFLSKKGKDATALKEELLDAIAPLDRGADATPEDQQTVDQIESSALVPLGGGGKRRGVGEGSILPSSQPSRVALPRNAIRGILCIARKLEAVNPIKEPLKSDLLNGKWELIYTTSRSILQIERPKFLRSRTNFQAINVDTLRAQNMESFPFFNQVTANLTPLNARKVAVKFDVFKIGGLITIKAPGRARGELEITYLDEELRVSRGDKGNVFVLKMIDPSYRVPV